MVKRASNPTDVHSIHRILDPQHPTVSLDTCKQRRAIGSLMRSARRVVGGGVRDQGDAEDHVHGHRDVQEEPRPGQMPDT
eukprot:904047-Rhodomonas_salina.2